MGFNQAVRALVKVNKDYAALIYSTLGKYIRELSEYMTTWAVQL